MCVRNVPNVLVRYLFGDKNYSLENIQQKICY